MHRGLRIFVTLAGVVLLGLGLRFLYYSVINKSSLARSDFKVEGISVSGIFPHLALFNENHASEKPGETGIGAVVPWGDKLYAISYSAHRPKGSSDKLYVIDQKGYVETHPLSVGGTSANRMIHKESRQLILGPYFIKENGEVRVIPPDQMPGRLTATARHLTDPANKVYFYTMEEGLYEVNVNSLEVTELYKDGNLMQPPDVAGPLLPGYHGKGAYTSQGRLVVANNGEYRWQTSLESGCLAEWDEKNWKIIERKQFTEVTGPGGLYGNTNSDDPIWATGWDDKSLILKLRDQGDWFTYRLPKASFTYDGRHGWHTEWPRIRNIGEEKWLMTMHGMFWAFPSDFSRDQTSGILPLSSYLKIIPDFAVWQGKLVMACDDASMFDNKLVGQPQSNFWFIDKDQLRNFGPRIGFGALWINEPVEAYKTSDPFLVGGFDRFQIYAVQNSGEALDLMIERRKTGSKEWESWKTILLTPGTGVTSVVSNTDQTEWLRFSVSKSVEYLTTVIHLTPVSYPDPDDGIFKALQPRGSSDIKMGWLRPDGESGDLTLFSNGDSYSRLNEKLEFQKEVISEKERAIREKLIPGDSTVSFDQASVIYTDSKGARWRLPYGYDGKPDAYEELNPRHIREVATERSLMNAGGIFYELPREISGGISRVKPITTHNRMIYDYCSWRGMLVITGCNPHVKADPPYFMDREENFGVWLGTIDDLWKFGKPTGKGGPWKDTPVEAGELSDPFLLYGFDRKSLEISHDSNEIVSFELLADFVGNGAFREFGSVQVNSGEVGSYQFEEGFSAFWVKIRALQACMASARFNFE